MNQKNNMFPEGLSTLTNPKILLTKGLPGSWEESGVRDPSILMDEQGNPAILDGKMVMYYTGSQNLCTIQSIGCALSSDYGYTWNKYESNPVIYPSEDSHETVIASTPWAIKHRSGKVYLYYRSSNDERNSVSLAISEDGLRFTKYKSNPILTSDDFVDIPEFGGMGVMNCAVLPNGKYILTFEAESKAYKYAQIFGAVSKDGINFSPLNNGMSLLNASNIRHWPVSRVCNPRITVIDDTILLGFNAHYHNGQYSVGFVASKDLHTWHNFEGNPILLPNSLTPNNPFSGRIEGPVLLFEDQNKQKLDRIIFMAIPRKGPSHVDAVIASVNSTEQKLPNWLKVGVSSGLLIHSGDQYYDIINDSTNNAIFYINMELLQEPIFFELKSYDFWISSEYNTLLDDAADSIYTINNKKTFQKVLLFNKGISKKIKRKILNAIPSLKSFFDYLNFTKTTSISLVGIDISSNTMSISRRDGILGVRIKSKYFRIRTKKENV